MVQILAPKGWVPPPESKQSLAETPFDPVDRYIDRAAPAPADMAPKMDVPGNRTSAGTGTSQTLPDTVIGLSGEIGTAIQRSENRSQSPSAAQLPPVGMADGGSGLGPKPPPLPKVSPAPPLAGHSTALPLPDPASTPLLPGQVPAPPPVNVVQRKWPWPTWATMIGVSCGAVILGSCVWWLLPRPSRPDADAIPVAAAHQVTQIETAAAVPSPQHSLPWDQQWLPEDTRLLVCLQLGELVGMPQSQRWIDEAHPLWQQVISPSLQAFGLRPDQVERLLCAVTDLNAGPRVDLLLIKRPVGTSVVVRKAQSLDFALAGVVGQRLEDAGWQYPFVVIDAQTIVTGAEPVLRKLAARPRSELKSAPLRRLLTALPSESTASVRLDLAAARAAGWPLPNTWCDIWPPGREAWHAVWEVPDGLGLAIKAGDRVHAELALSCEASTAAERVSGLLESLLDHGRQAVAVGLESMIDKLQAGRFNAAVGDQYELLLRRGLSAMRSARVTVANEVISLQVDWDLPLSALVKALLESRPALHGEWLDAARTADEVNHRRLLASLQGYQKAEGIFPIGAAGGSLLPPETRLSWLATMLPYFGQSDWHRELEFSYPWNAAQNKGVSNRPLSAVVNPTLGPATSEAGFPVTHYVGCAGVGADAGCLNSDDPRAGVFGFARSTRPEDLADGASHTIAILPVARDPGPWAAGGAATVRGLLQAPYVNGPDGFGSGQPDGMYVGMADGSVRFVSKDVDPQILEQLATVRGDKSVDLARLDPKPSPHKKTETRAGPVPPQTPITSSPAPSKPIVDEMTVPPKPAHSAIDVAPRLAVMIPRIEMKDTPLEDVIALAAQLGQVPLTLDLDAMARLNVKLGDRVSVRLGNATVAKVLQNAAAARGLDLVVEGNLVLITSPADERQKLYNERYDVSDLLRNGPSDLLKLAAMTRELVVPESWKSAGGRGTITPQDSSLIIEQTAAVHWQVMYFYEKLRTARHLPLRGSWEPQNLELASRHARAAGALAQTVTVNLHQTVSLQKAVALLENATKVQILVDWAGLNLAGVGIPVDVAARLDRQPLSAALERLLEPLGLSYRVVAPDLLEITTRKVVGDRLELEFYPVSDLAGRQAPQALVEQVRGNVARNTWTDAGGPAVICFDGPSKSLLVLQSQPIQVSVERFLGQLRQKLAEERRGKAEAPK